MKRVRIGELSRPPRNAVAVLVNGRAGEGRPGRRRPPLNHSLQRVTAAGAVRAGLSASKPRGRGRDPNAEDCDRTPDPNGGNSLCLWLGRTRWLTANGWKISAAMTSHGSVAEPTSTTGEHRLRDGARVGWTRSRFQDQVVTGRHPTPPTAPAGRRCPHRRPHRCHPGTAYPRIV
jgi:hypothetical protein